jgi:hypothetical protein
LAKFNVWQKRPKTRTPQTKTFQDIDEDSGEPDGEPFDLTFWRLTDPEESRALEIRDMLVERYLGDPENNVKAERDFPPVGDEAVELSKPMLLNAAVMEMMQPPFAADRYTAEEFVAMRARLSEPTRREIALFMNSVKKKKQADDVIPEGTSV